MNDNTVRLASLEQRADLGEVPTELPSLLVAILMGAR